MFSSLARRLTAWYVFVAIGLVVVFAGGLAFGALSLYARSINEQIAAAVHGVPDVELRARIEHENFHAAEARLRTRLTRPGLVVRAFPPPPGMKSLPRQGEFGVFRLPGVAGPIAPNFNPRAFDKEIRRYETTSRFGHGAATLLGIRPGRVPFMGGLAIVSADDDRFQWVVVTALLTVAVIGVLGGLLAWAIGRYITLQALRPLYEVTAALQRFAGRDFTAQPIDVASRGEFSELAAAYNAASAQVEEAFAEREAAELQMRQFVADAGHELRTPLTILLGYIDMLRRRAPDDERSRRIFATIAIEGSRMRTLIDNLVLLARLEGENVRPIEPFDLTALLEHDVVETRLGIAPDVRFELEIGADATVIGDRNEIYEAIANIVDNAIKYAPSSPIRIAVRAAGLGVEVAIGDRGPGIPASDRGAIFDRFYRGAARGDVEGSGLGLAIAKRAIERAGGTLTLADNEPRGTTFTVALRVDRICERPPVARPVVTTP